MAVWINNDGLVVRFHNDEAVVSKGGSLPPAGANEILMFEVDATSITSTAGTVLDHALVLPSGVRIEKVEVIAETLCTSAGAATLNIGLARLDRTTELDNDGLVAALALTAIDTAGETNILLKGTTGAGALMGTTLANAGVITLNYGTAAYTAGKLVIRVHVYRP